MGADTDYEAIKARLYDMTERKDLKVFEEMGGLEGIAQQLESDINHGVTSASVDARVLNYGINELPQAKRITFLELVWGALKDNIMRMLIIAAVISIIFGLTLPDPHSGKVDRIHGWIEGTAILISVTVVVLVTALSDWQKAKKFEELNAKQQEQEVDVIRDDKKHSIDATKLVVGDVMLIKNGDTLPVDLLFIEGQDLKCDESAATGESDVQKKNAAKDPFFLSGTNVTEGEGRGLVTAVGINSFSGKLTMAARGDGEVPLTPLQEKLAKLADYIGKIGFVMAVLTFLVLTIKDIVPMARKEKDFSIIPYLNHIIIGISVIVVAIPEGLPLAVTIALAYGMKSMMDDNCLVRVLASCETMGGASAICSDKTGTLTKNEMTVVQGYLCGENFFIQGYEVKGEEGASSVVRDDPKLKTDKRVLDMVCVSLSLNSTAEEIIKDDKLQWVGNKTEYGLLGFCKRFERNFMEMRNNISRDKKRSYPFSSAKKRMTTFVKEDDKPYFTVHVKGASELVLEDCTSLYTSSYGERKPMTDELRKQFMNAINHMASQGNRTIAIAMGEYPIQDGGFPDEEPAVALSLLAILGIQDPIREEVPSAVAQCKSAGITVRMVTGDNKDTAVAIAKKCGIYVEGEHEVMEGKDFRHLAATDNDKLRKMLPQLRVLARSSPTDKHVLVANLLAMGDVVAVTGDGTNDAPALKLASVGFAMKSGTDVAKNASEMILMDDNFRSVVRATVWGRTVNDNIRKFLQFQLTVNIVGVLLTFIGSAVSTNNESPLKAVQLLWLNLIMDTMAALALATEKPTDQCLERPPIHKTAFLVSRKMWVFVLTHAAYQLTTVLLLFNLGHKWIGVGPCEEADNGADDDDGDCKYGLVHGTIVFNTFVLFQVFNEFNARKLYGEWNPFEGLWSRNRLLLYIFFIICGFQIFAVEVAGDFMSTRSLNGKQWAVCIIVASVEIVIGVIVRIVQKFVHEPIPKKEEIEPELPPEIQSLARNDEETLKQLEVAATVVKAAVRLGSYSKKMPMPGSTVHPAPAAEGGDIRVPIHGQPAAKPPQPERSWSRAITVRRRDSAVDALSRRRLPSISVSPIYTSG